MQDEEWHTLTGRQIPPLTYNAKPNPRDLNASDTRQVSWLAHHRMIAHLPKHLLSDIKTANILRAYSDGFAQASHLIPF